MIFSKEEIEKIKKIFDKAYSELAEYAEGDEDSLLDQVYHHVFPKGDLRSSLKHAEISKEHLNSMLKQLLEKHRANVVSRVEGFLRETNTAAKYRPNWKEPLNKLKQNLKDLSKDMNRDWRRIASTEVSNAIGLASVDRIASHNKDKDFSEIYVYRIVVQDAAMCKWCKKFYLDTDGSPAVYRLSELIANNTNYGKHTSDWKPVAGATHPNERCSPTIELKPGFKVLPGGTQTYIGTKGWNSYIKSKLK